MRILEKVIPKFLRDDNNELDKDRLNFRRLWRLSVLLTAVVSLVPLVFMTLLHYHLAQQYLESESYNHTYRFVSNTWRYVASFLDERKTVLELFAHQYSFEELNNQGQLEAIFDNVKKRLGGIRDIGVINSSGIQTNYVGPYKLKGINYSNQEWFKKVLKHNSYISDVFLGFRNAPHMVIACKFDQPDNSFFVFRVTLDLEQINRMLNQLEMAGSTCTSLVNHKGMLQTTCRHHPEVLKKMSYPVPKFATESQVIEGKDPKGRPVLIGYRYIPGTPFILMIVEQKGAILSTWHKSQIQLVAFLVGSVTLIVLVILGVATYLVNRIYVADRERVSSLHKVEYSNRLASIGRLAAGVAHEVNNPLAIINEKAGLIKDMFTYKKMYSEDTKLIGLIDSIISSVERCGTITKRLLGFARHMEVSIRSINVREVLEEVLGFLEKEAEYRSIKVSLNVPDDIPEFESDRGKVQQIFLNLVNNAFAAMEDGGSLDITVKRKDEDFISATVTDTGCGIKEADIKRIFEPFFSTKTKKGGTGLGLSITCGLIQEIGGKINVQSEVGKGTTFIITLPLKFDKERK
ncbi:MAG: two-component sensor histidine kinase [Deltaproteobacteria bacterium]|nr:MAG: two-component sensor histidine kinase [Deltaproteobacteria bacterium]